MKTLTVLWMVAFTFALLALGAVAPAAAWVPVVDRGELNDSQEPGSFLVFPKFRAGTVNTNEEGFLPRSEFEISVVCPQGATCSQDPTMPTHVLLKAVWICGSGDLNVTFPAQCGEQNFMIPTTVNSTVYFGAQGNLEVNLGSHAATFVPPPPCARGYLAVWVVGTDGRPIKYDALIGDAVLRTQTGNPVGGLATAGQYTAIPIQGSKYLNTGDAIPVDPVTGAVSFDGSGYQAVTGAIKGTVRYPGPTFKPVAVGVAPVQTGAIRTSLVLLTLDVSLGFTNPPTHVDLEYSNESEVVHSNPAQFVCWGEERLGEAPLTGMTNNFGRKGNLESGPAQQIDVVTGTPIKYSTLLGLIQTQELSYPAGYVLREYYYLLYNDSIPVPTDFGSVALP
jgi:hypothetical protein